MFKSQFIVIGSDYRFTDLNIKKIIQQPISVNDGEPVVPVASQHLIVGVVTVLSDPKLCHVAIKNKNSAVSTIEVAPTGNDKVLIVPIIKNN